MKPTDFQLLFPHLSNNDTLFLKLMLCLDPNKRETAQGLVNSSYFKEFPPPCPLCELPLIPSEESRKASSVLPKKDQDIDDYLKSFLLNP